LDCVTGHAEPLLFSLIRKLNDQRFHSGEDLAAEYAISRVTKNNGLNIRR
jgi:hypothetical protein